MALQRSDAARYYRSAVAMLRQSPTPLGEGELTNRLIRGLGQQEGQSFQAYQAVARQAIRGVDAAERVTDAGAVPLRRAEIPLGPAPEPLAEGYTYRALVVVRNPDNNEEVRYAADVSSARIQSFAQISAFIEENFRDLAYRRSTRRDIGRLGSNAVVETILLAVSRTN